MLTWQITLGTLQVRRARCYVRWCCFPLSLGGAAFSFLFLLGGAVFLLSPYGCCWLPSFTFVCGGASPPVPFWWCWVATCFFGVVLLSRSHLWVSLLLRSAAAFLHFGGAALPSSFYVWCHSHPSSFLGGGAFSLSPLVWCCFLERSSTPKAGKEGSTTTRRSHEAAPPKRGDGGEQHHPKRWRGEKKERTSTLLLFHFNLICLVLQCFRNIICQHCA